MSDTIYLIFVTSRNQCLSPLMLWVWISIRARCTTLCDKVCQWLATGRWFSPVSSTNKTDHHDITEILLKVALNTSTKPSHRSKWNINTAAKVYTKSSIIDAPSWYLNELQKELLLVGSILLIFFVFYIVFRFCVFVCLRPVSSVPNIESVIGLLILDCFRFFLTFFFHYDFYF